NPATLIEYRLPRDGRVRLEVFNDSGQRVEVLADGWRQAGAHVAAWDTGSQGSGVYFYRFWADGFAQTRKMLLIR
ncbi:MAG: T9SS type A sorting domain-containing protein, partial [Candidatus Latescibacteria bacterium]|nr:T9SS type A sorting domain-containing protein [Candidatus Latescibacterota bacterium]